MPYPSNSVHPVRRWVLTIFVSAVTFLGLWGLTTVLVDTDTEAELAYAVAERNALRDLAQEIKQQNLCGVLAYLVQRSNASLPTIAYYKSHPDELERAQEANKETLRLLDCRPIVPPPAVELVPEIVHPDYPGRH